MKEDDKGLLDRYVIEVGKHLPRKNRVDIEREIRSSLEDMLEDRSKESGQPVDDALILDLLRGYGAPETVAATYLPERYLIGPRLYPFFSMVVKIVWAAGVLRQAQDGVVELETPMRVVPSRGNDSLSHPSLGLLNGPLASSQTPDNSILSLAKDARHNQCHIEASRSPPTSDAPGAGQAVDTGVWTGITCRSDAMRYEERPCQSDESTAERHMSNREDIGAALKEIGKRSQVVVRSVAELASVVLVTGLGVAGLAIDEATGMAERMVSRGEVAEKDARRMVSDLRRRSYSTAEPAREEMEKQMESVLNRLNIPTRQDISNLNARISSLSGQLDTIISERTARSVPRPKRTRRPPEKP